MRKILSLLVVFAIAFQVSTALPAPEPQILQYFQSTFNAIANLGTNLLTPIRTSLTNLVNGLISTLASLGQTIASTVNPLQTIPEDVIEAALELLNAKGELIQGSLETIVDGLNLTAASIPSLGNLASGIQDALQSLPAAISANIAQPLSNIIETLANASANPDLSSIIGPLTEAVEQALSPLGNLANATAANIASNFVAAFQNIGPVINNFLTQATSLVNNDAAAQVLTQLVKNMEDLVKGVVTSADQLSNAVQNVLLDIARRAQQVALDIGTALNNAVAFVTGKAAEAATAIRNTFTDALSRLSGLRSVATTALNGAKAIAGAFNNTLNAFGLQARAIQADLANFVTALNTSATNAYAQIEAASANLTAAINKAVATASAQLTNLYTGLQADIVAAMNSGNAKAIACATIARDAIVANTQTAGNAIATCSASARSSANTASDVALTGLAAQFNIASTANANVANCITNYNTNKDAMAGATCLVSVGVNALRTASTTAIYTLMTTFTSTVGGIVATTQTCTSAALTAAQTQASATNAAFQQCLNA